MFLEAPKVGFYHQYTQNMGWTFLEIHRDFNNRKKQEGRGRDGGNMHSFTYPLCNFSTKIGVEHNLPSINRTPQATPCGATIAAWVSFTFELTFYIHYFGNKKIAGIFNKIR